MWLTRFSIAFSLWSFVEIKPNCLGGSNYKELHLSYKKCTSQWLWNMETLFSILLFFKNLSFIFKGRRKMNKRSEIKGSYFRYFNQEEKPRKRKLKEAELDKDSNWVVIFSSSCRQVVTLQPFKYWSKRNLVPLFWFLLSLCGIVENFDNIF